MILRRIIAHFRKQEWTAIAIDFVIVVLGVFVGIQLGNWNEARLERAQAAVFTRALVADLHADAVVYRGVAGYYASVSDNAERALESLEAGAPLSDEDFLISAYRASQVALVPVNRSTFEELVSTGRINADATSGRAGRRRCFFIFLAMASPTVRPAKTISSRSMPRSPTLPICRSMAWP